LCHVANREITWVFHIAAGLVQTHPKGRSHTNFTYAMHTHTHTLAPKLFITAQVRHITTRNALFLASTNQTAAMHFKRCDRTNFTSALLPHMTTNNNNNIPRTAQAAEIEEEEVALGLDKEREVFDDEMVGDSRDCSIAAS
jgi:hypothetical protein